LFYFGDEMKVKDIIKEFEERQADVKEAISYMGKPCRNIEEDIRLVGAFFEFLGREIEFVT